MGLLLGCLIEASSDWVNSLNPPSMTLGAIALDTLGLLLVGMLIGVPVAVLLWNRLISPIFGVPRIRYVHALILVTVAYWINGL
jgi:hypothetical protein